MSEILRRRVAGRARFYLLQVERDLWGRVTVLREWGRVGSPGRVRVDFYDEPQDAAAWLAWVRRVKLRKGYASTGASEPGERPSVPLGGPGYAD